jgi:hypothetical protein
MQQCRVLTLGGRLDHRHKKDDANTGATHQAAVSAIVG